MRLQREKEREERERNVLNEYESRIETEHRKKAEAEDTIDRMEREERDLIDRLKKTQELQQQVSQKLTVRSQHNIYFSMSSLCYSPTLLHRHIQRCSSPLNRDILKSYRSKIWNLQKQKICNQK